MRIKNSKVDIRDTEEHIISSSIVGDDYKICVALPKGYVDGNKNYPVIYLLDANIFFGLFTDTARLLQYGKEMPEVIIIGIGYPDDNMHLHLRYRDFGPTPYDMPEIAGKANNFIGFIRDELMPYVNKEYRIDSLDCTVAGDSMSGLFALYTLFHKPETFNRYIIGSPSMYWDDAITFQYEEFYAKTHKSLNAKVFVSVGALEAIYEPEFAAMVGNVEKLSKILKDRNYLGLELVDHVFEEETHLSVIPATMSRGLREIYKSAK